MNRARLILGLATLVLLLVGCEQPALDLERDETAIAFRNGLWFNGSGFESGDLFSVGGRLTTLAPDVLHMEIELEGRYVVPPYGEAHTHFLEANIEPYIAHYLHRGVFYAREQAGVPWIREQVAGAMNMATSIDFQSANQGFTGSGGHPLQILGMAKSFGWLPAEWDEAALDGEGIFLIDRPEDLREKWPRFLAGGPDLVKIFLHYSEEHEKRADDPEFLYQRGLNPAFAKEIVQLAKAEGLPVSAHGFTAADFRAAIDAGVDQFAHFPGTGFDPELGPEAFLLTEVDANRAAELGLSVVTTIADLIPDPSDLEPETRQLVDTVIRSNFSLLRNAGVPILVGSDLPRRTTDVEASLLHSLGLMDNLELLRAWAVDTPRILFPEREIGRLEEGFEASFLVLEGNPLEDFANTQRIQMRVKQGNLLFPRELEFDPIR